jgi:hypothetical protein
MLVMVNREESELLPRPAEVETWLVADQPEELKPIDGPKHAPHPSDAQIA